VWSGFAVPDIFGWSWLLSSSGAAAAAADSPGEKRQSVPEGGRRYQGASPSLVWND